MSYTPPFCPFKKCKSHKTLPFVWRKKGFYTRRCDGRKVQRFHCRICQKSFSSQTFRLDYRLHFVHRNVVIFNLLNSKVSQRQIARNVGCNYKTIARRLKLFGDHCQAFHQQMLDKVAHKGGVPNGIYQLDEMESFETNRRIQPVTIPVLIERNSYFVLHAESAPLPARGKLTPYHQIKKIAYEEKFGKRKSGSSKAVLNSFKKLNTFASRTIAFQSDKKRTYKTLLGKLYKGRISEYSTSLSTDPRCPGSRLFPINQTLAMMRDGISKLVRRSWCHAKKRISIDRHMWVWIAWRNYVRSITVRNLDETPAMVLEVCDKPWSAANLLRWRVFRHPFFGSL